MNGINILPSIEWVGPNGTVVNSERVSITILNEESETVSTLRFSPLLVTDEGTYTCRGTLAAPQISTQPSVLASTINLVVGDKKCGFMFCLYE